MAVDLEKVLAEFQSAHSTYVSFGIYTEELLAELLRVNRLQIHSVTHRVKTASSLRKKFLDHPEKSYESLDDITDLVGARVITYFSDTVDQVKGIVDGEFAVDKENSVDKRAAGGARGFGYASLSYDRKLWMKA